MISSFSAFFTTERIYHKTIATPLYVTAHRLAVTVTPFQARCAHRWSEICIKEYSHENFNSRFKDILNNIPEDMGFQFVIHNKLVRTDYFFDKVIKNPDEMPEYSDFIESYNNVIVDNADVGHNNVIKNSFFVISYKAELPEYAVSRFRAIDEMLKDLFFRTYGIEIEGMSLKSRLKVLYSMLNPGRDDFGRKADKKGTGDFTFKGMKKLNLTTKDLISPSSIDNREVHKDYVLINGDTFSRSFFVNMTPAVISNSIISDISSVSSNMLLSIQYDGIPEQLGLSVFTDKVAENMTRKIINRRDSLIDRKLKRTEELTQMINYTEDAYFNNAALDVFKEGAASGSRIYACTLTITLFADDLETLNRDTQLLYISANKFAVQVKSLDLLQLEGLQSCLPLRYLKVDAKRIYNLDKLASMHPLNIQEILKENGLFYGINAINDNLIFLNRKNFSNPAGIIAGVEHCGKTFQNKREIFNAVISGNDRICIIAADDSYDTFVDTLSGHIYENHKTNPFECVTHYGLLESDLYSKSVMLEALFKDFYITDKLTNVDFTRTEEDKDDAISSDVKKLIRLHEVHKIDLNDYETVLSYIEENAEGFEYISETLPLLREICGSRNIKPGRIHLFKIHSNSELICIMDFLFNRFLKDKERNLSSWLFVDGIDMLLNSEQGLDYIAEYVDKCNKLESIFTMIIQSSVKLMSNSKTMIRLEELVNSCGYFKLLNQGAIERRKYSELLNIPNSLINYITNVDYGKGLIITPSSNIAFDDNFIDGNNDFYSIFKL